MSEVAVMIKKLFFFLTALILSLLLIGCADNGRNDPSETSEPDTSDFKTTEDTASQTQDQTTEQPEMLKSEYQLFVNGKEIKLIDCYYYRWPSLYKGYYEIPFVAVLEAFGANIKWSSDTVAKVILINEEYTLDISKCSFVSKSSGMNYLLEPPGNSHSIRKETKELIVPDNFFALLLWHIDFEMRIERQGTVLCLEEKE